MSVHDSAATPSEAAPGQPSAAAGPPAVMAPEETAAGARFAEPLFVWTYEAEAAIETRPP